MHGCAKDCLILIPFRLPPSSCFTLSLKRFSSDSDNRPAVGIGPLLQFPHPPRAGLVLRTLLFSPLVPSAYRVLKVNLQVTQPCPTLCDPMDSPWNSPGQNTGVGSLFLLQQIFPTQESKKGLLHCRWNLYQLSYREAHEFCMDLYILFRWSGTPVCSQRVFCMHFCVWRCIPGVSVERDVLHIHLLLRHLVLYLKWIFERSVFSCLWPTFSSSYSYCWHSA